MGKENELKCCISGSFDKFKPEIDLAIEEFQDLGVRVLSPDKGWLYIPKPYVLKLTDKWKPLPSERGMDLRQIEDRHLLGISKSDFLYVMNKEGYLGLTVLMEMGLAVAREVPIFSKEKITEDSDPDNPFDDFWKERIADIKLATPSEVVKSLLSLRVSDHIDP